jgi:hypothetical protein
MALFPKASARIVAVVVLVLVIDPARVAVLLVVT